MRIFQRRVLSFLFSSANISIIPKKLTKNDKNVKQLLCCLRDLFVLTTILFAECSPVRKVLKRPLSAANASPFQLCFDVLGLFHRPANHPMLHHVPPTRQDFLLESLPIFLRKARLQERGEKKMKEEKRG